MKDEKAILAPLLRSAPRRSIGEDDSAEAAFQRLFSDFGLDAARNLAAALRSDEPEPPHQIRVSLRRLRSLLWLYRDLIDHDSAAALNDAAKAFAGEVGRLRDLDVLALETVPMGSEGADPEAVAALSARLEARRSAAREAFLATAAVEGAALLLAMHRYQLEEAWRPSGAKARKALRGPVRDVARAGLARAWRKADRWGARIETLEIAERHEMRKALKRLRYASSFFAPLFPEKRVRPFLAQLRTLQNVFGYLNDVAAAERLPEFAETQSERAAAEAVIGRHRVEAEAAWRKARKRWGALEDARRFWR